MLAICECSSTQLNVSSQNSRLLQAEQREYSQLQSSCFGGSLVFINNNNNNNSNNKDLYSAKSLKSKALFTIKNI